MLILEFSRPNTIGITFQREYDSYSDAEELIERYCEQLADEGWELTELKGSTSRSGTIECTHAYKADVLLINWRTI